MLVGFTGHQKIDCPERWGWVEDRFKLALAASAPAATGAISSLAAGGDQLFSRAALAAGLRIEVVVPCAGYERAFDDPAARAAYAALLAQASRVVELDYPDPSEDAFLAAGMRVVDIADLVLCLWNGKAAAGRGGTGDIVGYARGLGKPVTYINPDTMQVVGPGR